MLTSVWALRDCQIRQQGDRLARVERDRLPVQADLGGTKQSQSQFGHFGTVTPLRSTTVQPTQNSFWP